MYTTFLSDVIIVDYLTIGQGSYFKKTVESTEIAHKCLFLDFLLQIDIDVAFHVLAGIPREIVGRNHAVVDSTVNFEIWYFRTDQRE